MRLTVKLSAKASATIFALISRPPRATFRDCSAYYGDCCAACVAVMRAGIYA